MVKNSNEVWWTGEASDAQWSANVFHGYIVCKNLIGIWCDMPSNSTNGCGQSLSLNLENNNRIVKATSSVPYNGNVWIRQSEPYAICPFNTANLPQLFRISVFGSTKYSKCSRIGNSGLMDKMVGKNCCVRCI